MAVGSVEGGWLLSADPTAFISVTTADSTAVFCAANNETRSHLF